MLSLALGGQPAIEAFDQFARGGWNHAVVNRFAYVQIKKVGGGGRSNVHEICAHMLRSKGVV